MQGILIVDKPMEWTSFDVIAKLRGILGTRKLGHSGTLDPMATGVLPVFCGGASKAVDLQLDHTKTYCARLRLGMQTDTGDITGTVLETAPVTAGEKELLAVLPRFLGPQMQTPPMYSAVKINGQPLYKLSREGKETPLKIKTIEISRAEVLRVELPYVTFRIICSSGTYIRSLAHSLGTRLGCGAVLTELIREYSHPFGLDRACPLDTLLAEPETLPERVIPVTAALPHWPTITVTGQEEADTKNGKILVWTEARRARSRAQDGTDIPCVPGANAVLLSPDGQPLALAEAVSGGPAWKVLRGLWN